MLEIRDKRHIDCYFIIKKTLCLQLQERIKLKTVTFFPTTSFE